MESDGVCNLTHAVTATMHPHGNAPERYLAILGLTHGGVCSRCERCEKVCLVIDLKQSCASGSPSQASGICLPAIRA